MSSSHHLSLRLSASLTLLLVLLLLPCRTSLSPPPRPSAASPSSLRLLSTVAPRSLPCLSRSPSPTLRIHSATATEARLACSLLEELAMLERDAGGRKKKTEDDGGGTEGEGMQDEAFFDKVDSAAAQRSCSPRLRGGWRVPLDYGPSYLSPLVHDRRLEQLVECVLCHLPVDGDDSEPAAGAASARANARETKAQSRGEGQRRDGGDDADGEKVPPKKLSSPPTLLPPPPPPSSLSSSSAAALASAPLRRVADASSETATDIPLSSFASCAWGLATLGARHVASLGGHSPVRVFGLLANVCEDKIRSYCYDDEHSADIDATSTTLSSSSPSTTLTTASPSSQLSPAASLAAASLAAASSSPPSPNALRLIPFQPPHSVAHCMWSFACVYACTGVRSDSLFRSCASCLLRPQRRGGDGPPRGAKAKAAPVVEDLDFSERAAVLWALAVRGSVRKDDVVEELKDRLRRSVAKALLEFGDGSEECSGGPGAESKQKEQGGQRPSRITISTQDVVTATWSLSHLGLLDSAVLDSATARLAAASDESFNDLRPVELSRLAVVLARGAQGGRRQEGGAKGRRKEREDTEKVVAKVVHSALREVQVRGASRAESVVASASPGDLGRLLWAVAHSSSSSSSSSSAAGAQSASANEVGDGKESAGRDRKARATLAQKAVDAIGRSLGPAKGGGTQSLDSCSADDLACIAWAYGKMGNICEAASARETYATLGRVYSAIEDKLVRWREGLHVVDDDDLDGVATSASEAAEDVVLATPTHASLVPATRRTSPRRLRPLYELPIDPGVLCKGVWSFATLAQAKDGKVLAGGAPNIAMLAADIFTINQGEMLRRISVRDVVRLAWSCAVAGGGEGGEGKVSFAERSALQKKMCAHIVSLLNESDRVSQGGTGAPAPAATTTTTTNLTPTTLLDAMHVSDVANVVWALATMGAGAGELTAKLALRNEDIKELGSAATASLLWGMVKMGFLEDIAQREIVLKVVNGLESKVGGFEEDDIERTLWAVGVMLKKFGNAGEGSGGEVEKALAAKCKEAQALLVKRAAIICRVLSATELRVLLTSFAAASEINRGTWPVTRVDVLFKAAEAVVYGRLAALGMAGDGALGGSEGGRADGARSAFGTSCEVVGGGGAGGILEVVAKAAVAAEEVKRESEKEKEREKKEKNKEQNVEKKEGAGTGKGTGKEDGGTVLRRLAEEISAFQVGTAERVEEVIRESEETAAFELGRCRASIETYWRRREKERETEGKAGKKMLVDKKKAISQLFEGR